MGNPFKKCPHKVSTIPGTGFVPADSPSIAAGRSFSVNPFRKGNMAKELPDENGFAIEIVDALIGHKASPEVITIVKSLMDHTFGHP